eukprot:773084-Rhodomonas_salina.1
MARRIPEMCVWKNWIDRRRHEAFVPIFKSEADFRCPIVLPVLPACVSPARSRSRASRLQSAACAGRGAPSQRRQLQAEQPEELRVSLAGLTLSLLLQVT